MVFDLAGDEDDALAQQARIDVVGAFAATGGLDDHGHHAQGLRFKCAHGGVLFS